MADYFLDPVSGNNANDGTSFANRKQTVAGFTAAILAPGDTVRIIASPDPTTPGSATWTDNSGTITWAAQKNLTVDNCETNWTAAANVTCAQETATAKQGTYAQKVTPTTGFTTGKMAYRTLPATLDLSAYEQISLWFSHGSPATAGAFELKLCSDTTGDTPVNTLAIPVGEYGYWQATVLNNGAALGATINSIAIYATTALTVNFPCKLDNIVACKAAASADCVTHRHAIGKNTVGEPDWYSIQVINDSSVQLGGGQQSYYNDMRPYRGTSESVATYLLLGMPAMALTDATAQENGTLAAPILYSGGWSRTDMSTQTGVTYLNGYHFRECGINLAAKSYNNVEKVGSIGMREAVVRCTGATGFDLDLEQAVGCHYGPYYTTGSPVSPYRIKFDSAWGMSNNDGLQTGYNYLMGDASLIGRRAHGAANGPAVRLYDVVRIAIDKIDNNVTGVDAAFSSAGLKCWLDGATIENNTTDFSLNFGEGIMYLNDVSVASLPAMTTAGTFKVTRFNGSSTDVRTITQKYAIATDATTRHTASGVSWKVSPLDAAAFGSFAPVRFSLAQIACNAGTLVTVKAWVRRDNTGLSLGMRIPAKAIPGIGNDDLQTMMTAAIDTWEQITLTFTPTVAGVVEVFGVAWGGATYNGWFDDLTVTQD